MRLNIFLSLTALVIALIFVHVLPKDEKASAFENRSMETFPELSAENFFSGDFFSRLELFLLDNTANRTTWLTLSQIVDHSFGLHFSGGAMMVEFNAGDLGIGLVAEEMSDLHNINVVMGSNIPPFGVDINFNEDAVFYLRYTEDQVSASRYAEVLNAYKAGLPDNVQMYSLLAPVKVEFMDERYTAVNSSQLGTINYINSLLNDDIITIDVHSILSENVAEYLYFRTDHHWTALGAYYAYLAFAETAGFEPITIDNYTEYYIEGFVGSLAVGTRNRTILSHPDTIYFYTLNNDITFSINMFVIPTDISNLNFRVFLGGDRDIYEFTTSNVNGRTLAVVKDSFANAMIPWVAPHYETIIVIDPRQFTGSVLQELAGYDNIDLLFVNYLPATTMPELIEQIYDAR